MQIFCYIPAPCLNPKAEVSDQVRSMLERALELGLGPAPLPRGLGGQPVRFDGELLAKVENLSAQYSLAKGRVVGGLIYALHIQASTNEYRELKAHPQQVLAPITDGLRPGQVRCLMEAAPLIKTGKVIAAECGTGSGKSRIIAHAAAYVLALRDHQCPPLVPMDINAKSNPDSAATPEFIRDYAAAAQGVARDRAGLLGTQSPRAVIVAAPSVENVSHLAREWAAVREVLQRDRPISTAVVLGRGQFVSSSQLRNQLLESENRFTEIEAWLDKGMPPGKIPATRHLQLIEPSICCLMADLEAMASQAELDIASVALDEDSPEEEQTVYKALRSKAFSSDLIWTTHAMLCLDTLRLAHADAQALLPPPLAVLVDEAHMLEQSQAAVTAKSMSLMRLLTELRSPLWSAIRRQGATEDVATRVKELTRRLAEMPNETPLPVNTTGDPGLIKMWDAALPVLRELQGSLGRLVEGANKSSYANQRAQYGKSLRYVLRCMQAIEQIGKDYRGHIEHSPKRNFLSFNVGPTTVDKYLAARWATTPTVMLLSGMLHYIGAMGTNFRAVHRELRVPDTRQASTAPMHPGWVTGTPVLYTPSPAVFHRLMPPTGDEVNELSMASWLAECAKVIHLAATDAAGGMLVLMSGYDRLECLAGAIEHGFPGLSSRLIVQSRLTRLASLVPEFKARARAGERPIWLATGSAWTGLDLADEEVTDEESFKDLILTDLVIPNLPFGLQRNTTHVAKVARLGFSIEQTATQRMFRNGLGRGVRRDGLKLRRYWVLDGRLQHPATANYTADLRRVLQMYLHRQSFTI